MLKGIDGDEGLVIKDKAAHHAISAKFAEPLTNEGKTLVAQYEVKLQSEFLDLVNATIACLLTYRVQRWTGVWRCVHEAASG